MNEKHERYEYKVKRSDAMNVNPGGNQQEEEVYEDEKYEDADGLEDGNFYIKQVQQNIPHKKVPFSKRS